MSNLFYQDLQNKSDGTYEQEIRAKVIDEFAEKLNKKISEFVLEHKDNLDFASGISVAWNIVDEVTEQMKQQERAKDMSDVIAKLERMKDNAENYYWECMNNPNLPCEYDISDLAAKKLDTITIILGMIKKADGCPLRELPQKKEQYLSINNEKGYCEGYNACIDDILRGSE